MGESLGDVIASYDRAFAAEGIRDSDSFYAWVVDLMDLVPGSSVLDAGCGEGVFLQYAQQRDLRAYGVDISLVALETARVRLTDPAVARADGESLPFRTGRFDGVACLGSLEHYLNPGEGVREIARVLAKDGVAAIALPNSYYLVDIIWQVWRTGYGPDHKQLVQRFATLREWEVFLTAGGLRVIRVYKHNFRFPRCKADLAWYRSYPRKILNLLVAPFVPFNLSNSFVYICRKKA